MNPFGQLPVIDDVGVVVTGSGAILVYLARPSSMRRKSGRLIPADPAGEAQVLRWCFAALDSIELPVLASWFVEIDGGRGTPGEALRGWTTTRIGQLDTWLADRAFVATDGFTVADLLLTPVLGGRTDPARVAPFANVRAYCERNTAARKRACNAYRERVEAS